MNHEITGVEHLHLHTGIGSILDGIGMPDQYCEKAKKINQQYLCITDHGYLSAIPAQLRACDKFGIKSILGVEIYLQRGHDPNVFNTLTPSEKAKIRKSHHLLLIASSNIGYQNLVSLTSWAHLKGFYYKPRITFDLLKKHSEGIIVCSCCIMGEIGQAFVNSGVEAAESLVVEYYEAFKNNFYLELMMLDYEPQKAYDAFLIQMHDKYNIPLVLTQDVHYCEKVDSEAQTNLLLIQTKRSRADLEKLVASGNTDMFEIQDKNLYMKSENDLNLFWENTVYKDIIPYELFKEAKRNTVKVCERANGVKIDRSVKLPEIYDADEKLKEEIKKGFKNRRISGNEYKKRIAEEYDLITRKGFSSYFLIQKQVIDEARRYCREVLGTSETNAINPGRGSAASSLILYLLSITDVDPIRHGLLFSRFLSESRGRTIDYKFDELVISSVV